MKQIDQEPKATGACEDCVMPIGHPAPKLNQIRLLRCVRCPFCKQTVTAELSDTTITCLNCKASAKL